MTNGRILIQVDYHIRPNIGIWLSAQGGVRFPGWNSHTRWGITKSKRQPLKGCCGQHTVIQDVDEDAGNETFSRISVG